MNARPTPTPALLSTAALCVLTLCAFVPAPAHAQHWFRGNTHTHTSNSDGDSPPDSVARWYRDAGYDFLFITDHERITDPAPLNARFAAAGKFLLIPGQEVTQVVADPSRGGRRLQAHVNGLGLRRVVLPLGAQRVTGVSMQAAYARNLSAIADARGIAQVNHPNFRWSVRLEDLAGLPDSTLLEIWNAHTGVNNLGGVDSSGAVAPSTEALWDSLLTRGKVVFGIADDDAHSFRPADADSYALTRPGRGWIVVRAPELSEAAILRSLRRGDFYASTGVAFRELDLGARSVSVAIEAVEDARYTVEFVGRGGRILATAHGLRASYDTRGDEGYVRVRVTDSNGRRAWTQAVRIP